MPFPWAAAALAGGSLLEFGGQKKANARNIALAREQMAFQERMSSTAYQRAAKDIEAAGLNRVLALGGPSSSPGGQTATMQNPYSGAKGSALAIAQIENIRAQTEKTKAETDVLKPKAKIGETVGGALETGINSAAGAIPKVKQTLGDPKYWEAVKDRINRGIESVGQGASSAIETARNSKTLQSVQDFFQSEKPTRQEKSEFQQQWNSLPGHWKDKQRMAWMSQNFKGRWPDWAMDILYEHYPEARPK